MKPHAPDSSSRELLRGIALISLAVLLFAMTDSVSKYMTRHYPVPFILWIRFVFHALVILLFVGARQGLGFIATRRPGVQIARGLMLPLASLFYVTATRYMPLAETVAITFIAPFIVTLLAVWILKEKVRTSQWVVISLSFAGVLLIIRPGGALFDWPALLPMGTALMMAVYQVLTRQIAGQESPYTSIFYPGLIGALLFSLLLPYTWTEPLSWWHVVLMILNGAIAATAHLVLIKAFDHAPASRLAPFSYMQLVWAMLLAWIVFGDFPDAWALCGMGVVVGAGIYLAAQSKPATR